MKTATLANTGVNAQTLYQSTGNVSSPTQQVTVGQFPPLNPTFSRGVQVSDEYVFVKRGTYAVGISLSDLVSLAVNIEPNLSYVPYIITQPVSATGTFAKATLTSNNTNVSDADTVTIGNKTYTFKTALTPTEGEVLIGANADASLLNLIRAINHTGTPDTDYKCAAAHTQVSAASAVTAHAFLLTSLTIGTAANAYASTETAATLSFGGTTFAGGTAAPTFTLTKDSELAVTYLWQYSTDGSTWSTASGTVSGTTFSNGTTATLTCTPTTTGLTGAYIRCQVTNSLGTTNTDGRAVYTIT